MNSLDQHPLPLEKDAEGVIKFNLEFRQAAALSWEETAEMSAWRKILYRLGLTGQNAMRYQGLAYGNISKRIGLRSFLISGTQTGAKDLLEPEDYSRVFDFDLKTNRVCAEGPIAPSSEALTHGAIYEANPWACSVIHAHSPTIWRNAAGLGVCKTSQNIAYGTPEMGEAVKQAALLCESGLIAMGGHEDGVVAFACGISQAAIKLLLCLAKAEEFDYTKAFSRRDAKPAR